MNTHSDIPEKEVFYPKDIELLEQLNKFGLDTDLSTTQLFDQHTDTKTLNHSYYTQH